jgi:hypothetical protein
MVAALKSGEQALSAVLMKDGRVETVSGANADVAALAKKAEEEGKAAATVKRPTPSCPQCIPGSIGPAREVLLEFLDEEQHDSWAKDRFFIVYGGLTGNAYVLAHRHSPLARTLGRICADLDDQVVVHFHQTEVPPEEEVLAAKLILEHREPWLRNEATMLSRFYFTFFKPPSRRQPKFKNPFGGYHDGIADAQLTENIGRFAAALVRG